MAKTTVHIIFNAHLDPIWLWPWQQGMDEALATFRSACDRLDAHHDIYFSHGEAWVYRQVQLLDPPLFERIRKFVRAGRWEIIGGWWVQPDCNFPDALGLDRQIKLGKEYFQENFDFFPNIAFNPDSFGHNASLPGLLAANGQDHYVFMRPQEHEMHLPARTFRWRGYEGDPEITCFRIYGAYCHRSITEDLIRKCCSELPDGVTHTACFCGVGDHGGGPTESLISDIHNLQKTMKDVNIVFSTATKFFAALDRQKRKLPLVTGELQFHSIGCYSVQRATKILLKNATHRLRQTELLLARDPRLKGNKAAKQNHAADLQQLHTHWRNVVFHQFHDTLGGTCLPSAYNFVRNQLGAAEAFGEELLSQGLRRIMASFPDDEQQRIVLYNASDLPYEGWTTVQPWLGYASWSDAWTLADENGKPVQFQKIRREGLAGAENRLAVKLAAEPDQIRVLRIVPQGGKRDLPDGDTVGLTGDSHCFGNLCGAAVSLYPPEMVVGNWDLALPDVLLYPDNSDTWTHTLDRYTDQQEELPVWGAPEMLEKGPFLREVMQKGRIGDSELIRSFVIYVDRGDVEMHLRVNWQEHNKILKLVMPYTGCTGTRTDGIAGGALVRPQDGREYPVNGWTKLPLTDDGEALAIISPDVFALDATDERVRLTLLRSCQMAHHDPTPGGRPDVRYSDRGEHDFVFRFRAGTVNDADLTTEATAFLRPLIAADLTRGMKP